MSNFVNQQKVDLSIVIVNYNTKDDSLQCLDSIYNSQTGYTFEVIFVDNASTDLSLKVVAEQYPQAICVDMGYNAGFARANNEGIRRSHGEIVLLLNSDTVIQSDTIDQFINAMRETPNCVAAGCQLLHADGSWQYSGGALDKGFRWVTSIPFYGTFLSRLKRRKPEPIQNSGKQKVDWIIGAFLGVKRVAIENAGLMDEDFFLYAEEIEWCHRISRYGDLYLFLDVHIIHTLGVSSKKAFNDESQEILSIYSDKEKQRVLSILLFRYKCFGKVDAFLFLMHFVFGTIIYVPLRLIVGAIKGKNINSLVKEVVLYLRNVRVWTSHFLIMLKNKPFFYKVL